MGICTSNGRGKNLHEKGKMRVERTIGVVGKDVLNTDKPCDQEAENTNGLISSIHTPTKLIDKNINSSSTSPKGPNTSSKVYYRKRGCSKQSVSVLEDDMGQQITPTTPKMQGNVHKLDRNHEQTAHQLSTRIAAIDEAKLVNINIQEAETLWDIAKILGVTEGQFQRNNLQQLIIDMEDRDTKEAARLGSKKRTP